jgi:steroid 5-alpha reductase family enzyme
MLWLVRVPETLVLTLIYVFAQMTGVWLLALWVKNFSIIDFFWPIGLAACGWIYFLMGEHSSVAALAITLLSLWAARLALYLGLSRALKGFQDKRYAELSQNFGSKAWSFYWHYLLQGLLLWILALSFAFIGTRHQLQLSDYVSVGLCLIGIGGESLADWQLQQFKRQGQGGVCQQGLWFYSRHPNYFFDWLTWSGFALLASPATYGYLAWGSPLLLYLLMTKVTGPMTEAGSLKAKGEVYLHYQQRTSAFFPWFKLSR